MKKTILLIVACVITFATVRAQSSEVEATSQITKAEKFLSKTTLVKEDCIYRDKAGGLVIAVKVFTDLKTGEKIAALEFIPTLGNALLTAQTGGIPGRLGYIDMEHVDDLLLALETILAETNNSSRKDEYSIVYTSPSGIDVRCYFVGAGIISDGVIVFSRKSHYINEFGIWTEYIAGQANMDIKRLSKVITGIRESQIICEKELVEGTPLTMDAILANAAAKKEAQAEAEEFRKAEEARIAEEKRKEANATDLYKKEVTTSIVQVQQEYTKLELTDSPIFTAYKKAISKLMQSRVLRDWETLDVINTVMQNLIKENCSIDKTALETQLAEKTTPEEIIEVFKASL